MSTLLSTASLFLLFAAGGETPTGEAPATDDAPAPVDNTITWMWKDGLRFQTNDGRMKFKFGGRILWDSSFIAADRGLSRGFIATEDGTEFRAARIFISGDVGNDVFFKAEYDFAGNSTGAADKRPLIKDLYIGMKDVFGSVDVKAGHFKEAFSLEGMSSIRYSTFLERGLPSVFAPGRNNGIAFYDTAANDMVTWFIGAFKEGTDDAGFEMSDDGFAVTARVTASPVYAEDGTAVVHVGLSYSMRDSDGVRFRQKPEVHNSPSWLDTGVIPSSKDLDLLALELGGALGPVHGAIEYMTADVNGGTDPKFSGYYANLGFFLTGETRAYDRRSGAWDRTKPARDLNENGGIGAVEVAARISRLDLDDSGLVGTAGAGAPTTGRLDNFTLALNWYVNPNTRFMLNYIRADLNGGGETDIFAVRMQVDW